MSFQRAPDGPGEAPRVEVAGAERLREIEEEWWALWRGCPSATPFQSPAWLLPWTRHYAPGRCGAALLRRAGRLVALVPVFTWRGSLLLAGTGPSDYGDGLFLPGTEPLAGRLLAALPGVPCGAFDRVEFRQLRPGSALLDAPAPPGWAETRAQDETCLVVRLRGQDGLDAASKRCRSNWRQSVRRIAREGGAIELLPADQVPAGMRELERLHAVRWRDKGESGVLADPQLRALLTDAAPELARAGLLRLYRLRFGEETAAVLLGMAGNRAHCYYLSGFDPGRASISPSGALVGTAIAQAAREGACECDMLRGCERYKYRWGAEERRMHQRVFARR